MHSLPDCALSVMVRDCIAKNAIKPCSYTLCVSNLGAVFYRFDRSGLKYVLSSRDVFNSRRKEAQEPGVMIRDAGK